MTQYVSVAEALFFHQDQLQRFGGAEGIRDPGALESALFRPQTGYYATVLHEAAALLESLFQNHPFVDGNKRTAFAVVDVFLRINRYHFTVDSMAIYATLINLLEEGQFEFEHLLSWLQAVVQEI